MRSVQGDVLKKGRSAWFTIAELIVVIAILAVLATVWFLSLSWYREDSKDAALKSNVRSLYSAIVLESVSQSRSPRYFVRYETGAAFTGSSMVVFDRTPVVLVGGEWDVPGTNYTAWTPRYDRLRLDPEKFRLSGARFPRSPNTANAETPEWPYYVGIAEGTGAANHAGGNTSKTYSQVGTLLSNKTAYVMGDYAPETPAAVAGLIKDRANPSATWALVEWTPSWTEPACAETAVSGYSVPGLRNGESAAVRKNDPNGFWEIAASASCVSGTVHVSSETASCVENYVPAVGPSCIRDTCAGQAFDNAGVWAEAYPWAPGTWTWAYSETAGVCKFHCKSGYSWDGAACKKDCETPVSATSSGISYAFPAVNVLRHGESASLTGTHTFANGSLSLPFDFSCSDGANHVSVRAGVGGCETNYTWNASWTAPVCSADTRSASCWWSMPADAIATTAGTYSQTWNGSAWAPTTSWINNGSTCGFNCNAGRTYNAGSNSCDINIYTVSGSFGTNAAGANISVCGSNVTADASGNFSTTKNHGTVCNNIIATRTDYTCTTTTNWPASLTGNFTTVTGSCASNYTPGSITYSSSNTFVVPSGVTVINVYLGGGGWGGGGHGGAGQKGGNSQVGSIIAYGGNGGWGGWGIPWVSAGPGGAGGGGTWGTGGATGTTGVTQDGWAAAGWAGAASYGGKGGTANAGGGGGGGGGYRYGSIAVTSGQSIPVTVGAGGTGGSQSYYGGQNGVAGKVVISW